jgi:hypothetical protein
VPFQLLLTNISVFKSRPADNIRLTAAERNCQSGQPGLQCKVLSRATEGAIGSYRQNPKGRNCLSFDPCFDTFPAPASLVTKTRSGRRLAYPAGKGSKSICRTIAVNNRRVR